MLQLENTLERTTFLEVKLSKIIPNFLRHGAFELSFRPQTVVKYKECLGWILRDLGDIDITNLELSHVTILKEKIYSRGASDARVSSMVFALKSLLRYCEGLGLKVLNPAQIRPPKKTQEGSCLSLQRRSRTVYKSHSV